MIGIINYGAGNIFSLTSALERLKLNYDIVHSAENIDQYDRYIIPGVGHAGAAMHKLTQTGLVPFIKNFKKPVLGICVGMQLFTQFSEEGNATLIDLIPVKTHYFGGKTDLKIPHTGWNQVKIETENQLFNGLSDQNYFYFVHSYFIDYNTKFTIASADYGFKFSSALQKDNFYAVQFHPEKSGEAGENILRNFSKIS